MKDLPGDGSSAVREWLAALPTEEECIRASVEPYRHMTPEQRWEAFRALQRSMDVLLAGRPPIREDGEHPIWMHWMDSSLGRPR